MVEIKALIARRSQHNNLIFNIFGDSVFGNTTPVAMSQRLRTQFQHSLFQSLDLAARQIKDFGGFIDGDEAFDVLLDNKQPIKFFFTQLYIFPSHGDIFTELL